LRFEGIQSSNNERRKTIDGRFEREMKLLLIYSWLDKLTATKLQQ
jgi:hypothetical protein